MFAGRKLLLADDSLAIQKVIDLTFTDEGMHVTTFPDGQRALDHLEQETPDVILADIFMPGVDGYELCRTVKQSERFRHTPVMLLIGSFEPFDEAEARRAGADDVVTKPFQSIRELVSRVGLLLSGKQTVEAGQDHEYSTLGLTPTAPLPETQAESEAQSEPEPRVFVEAAAMPEHLEETVAGSSCSSDLEMQTADTIELERIDVELPAAWQPATTSQPEPMMMNEPLERESPHEAALIGAPEMNDQLSSSPAPPKTNEVLNDSILDLGDVDNFAPRAVAEDIILDLDYEEPRHEPTVDHFHEPLMVADEPAVSELVVEEPLSLSQEAVVENHEWSIVPEPPSAHVEPPAVPDVPAVIEAQVSSASPGGLSDEQIDAIARRVVEHLSDKVVREIAWEVVPDLAELLIKQKISDQK